MLGRIKRKLEMPLLSKELKAMANRKSTYILRSMVSLIIFTIFAIVLYSYFYYPPNPFFVFYAIFSGYVGEFLMTFLLSIQAGAVFLLLPGMMASAITTDKENETMELLLTSQLSPWNIIGEKYFSRIVPFLYLLLITLPLFGVFYSFGGAGHIQTLAPVALIISAAFYVSTFSLFMSVISSSTTSAVLKAYFFNFLFLVVYYAVLKAWRVLEQMAVGRMGPVFILGLAMPVGVSLIWIVLSRVYFRRWAFVRKKSFWQKFLQFYDNVIVVLNNIFAGGVVLVQDRGSRPYDNPILWRERRRLNVDNFRYCIRLLLLFAIPVCVISVCFTSSNNILPRVFSCVVVLGFSVYIATCSCTAMLGDLTSRTFDVLLTTPLSPKEYIQSKMRASLRLIGLVGVVYILSSLMFFQILNKVQWFKYTAVTLLVVLAFLYFARNLAMLLALWRKSKAQALFLTLIVLTVLQLAGVVCWQLGGRMKDVATVLMVSTDLVQVEWLVERLTMYIAYGSLYFGGYYSFRYAESVCYLQLLSALFYFSWALVFRWLIVKNAARNLDQYFRVSWQQIGYYAVIFTCCTILFCRLFCLNQHQHGNFMWNVNIAFIILVLIVIERNVGKIKGWMLPQ